MEEEMFPLRNLTCKFHRFDNIYSDHALLNLVIVFYFLSIHYIQYLIFSLAKRAGKLETVINSIVTKIDAVLMKLEKLDMSKNKRKATVNKILGTIKEGDNGKY